MPTKKPAVAVITRTKDRPLLLERAIKSVVNQTFEDWQMIIVNDAGDKQAVDPLVEKYADQAKDRIKVVHNKKSNGMEAASNIGLKSSDSTYVVIHDDDDAWDPTFLEKAVGFMESDEHLVNDIGGVICYSTRIVETISGNSVKENYREDYNGYLYELSFFRLCARNLFPPISFLYKRDAFKKLSGKFEGMYNEELPVLGDWEFNIRFMQEFEIGLIPEHLAYYYHRTKDKNASSQYANSVIGGMDKHQYYDNYLRNKWLKEDIKNNQLGLGYVTNLSRLLFDSHHQQWEANVRINSLVKQLSPELLEYEPKWYQKMWSKLTGRMIRPKNLHYDKP